MSMPNPGHSSSDRGTLRLSHSTTSLDTAERRVSGRDRVGQFRETRNVYALRPSDGHSSQAAATKDGAAGETMLNAASDVAPAFSSAAPEQHPPSPPRSPFM